jgi:hypothetical protein
MVKKKKIRGDEPILVKIHISVEMLQGNPLYSSLKQTKLSFCPFKKSENKRVELLETAPRMEERG